MCLGRFNDQAGTCLQPVGLIMDSYPTIDVLVKGDASGVLVTIAATDFDSAIHSKPGEQPVKKKRGRPRKIKEGI